MKILVKYGGNAMGPEADSALLDEVAALHRAGHLIVLVHGGGPEIDQALARAGVTTVRVDGLRVTSAEALEAVEAVLCGTANKRLVRGLLQRGVSAAGVSGQDAAILRARRATAPSGADLGFVGEIISVDATLPNALLAAGVLPVIAPVALSEDAAHAFNVNADTAAGAIAAALRADAYVALTNVERVLADPADRTSAIDALSLAQARAFASSEACASGMKPKMLAAIDAVANGAQRAYICAAKPGAIAGALAGRATVIG